MGCSGINDYDRFFDTDPPPTVAISKIIIRSFNAGCDGRDDYGPRVSVERSRIQVSALNY